MSVYQFLCIYLTSNCTCLNKLNKALRPEVVALEAAPNSSTC